MNRNTMRHGRNGGNKMPLLPTRPNQIQPRENEPIMYEYLQNIDRELNELKKKREFIEQQHGYFQDQREPVHNRPNKEREFSYNAPRYYEQLYEAPEASHSAYNNRPQPFEAPAQNNDYISLNSGRKRPNPWQNDNVSKRFSGFDGDNVEKSFGSRLGPKPSSRHVNEPMKYNQSYSPQKKTAPPKRNAVASQKPRPLMSFNPRGTYSSVRTEFKSKNKVSKAKVATARPNNLKTYPVATRKALIEQTVKADAYPIATRKPLVGKALQAAKNVEESMILHADGQQSRKVRGRLELAVGHILKSIKEQASAVLKEDLVNQSHNMQRNIKQILRERLRKLMLGKHVGPYVEIVAAYRERFPIETDQSMLIAAQETVKSIFKYRKADTPEEFLKLNVGIVLKKKLNEMFHKLEDIYSGKKETLKDTVVVVKDDTAGASATSEENDVVVIENVIQENSDSPEKSNKIMYSPEELDNVMQQRLPYLLKKFVPYITDIMNLDYTFESSIAEVVLKTQSSKPYIKSKMSEQLAKTQADKGTGNSENEKSTNNVPGKTNEKQSTGSPLHYVRIIGRPSLPKRKIMQTFLDEFKPKTIKKHKKQQNLLFVGFTEKKTFDDVIAKNGVAIGKYIIEIKPSDSSGNKAAENSTTDNVNNSESAEPQDTSFGSELDDQINDLLSSIRQGEEKNDDNIKDPITGDEKSGDFEFEAKDKNQVTIICESDDDKNEEAMTENSNSKMQSQSIHENIVNKSEYLTDETMDITEDNTEITENIIDKTEETTQKTENILEETEDTTEETKDITAKTKGVSEKTDEMYKNTTAITEIIEKQDVIVKVEDSVAAEKSSEINTPVDNNEVQEKESVTSNNTEQIDTEKIQTPQDEIIDSNNSLEAIKEEKIDENVKEDVRATPTRASTRLASVKPRTIQTRRTSKLTQNNE